MQRAACLWLVNHSTCLPMIGQPFDLPTYDWLSIRLTLAIVYFLRSESVVNLQKAWFSQQFSWVCCCHLDLHGKTISASIILSFIWSDRLFIFFYRDPMLISYSAYERVAFTAISTVVESLGYITSLLRLFRRLKVPSPVCFVCHSAITASGKFFSAVPPNMYPVWAGLKISCCSGPLMEKIRNFSWSSLNFIKIQISRFLQVGAKSCDKICICCGGQLEWNYPYNGEIAWRKLYVSRKCLQMDSSIQGGQKKHHRWAKTWTAEAKTSENGWKHHTLTEGLQ